MNLKEASEIKECPHYRGSNWTRSGHFVHGVCEECVVKRWIACNELVDIRDRQLELERQRSQVLAKALKYYEKPVFCAGCMLNVERGDTAKEALNKFEEMK